jgi:branched-chain amino acid transport system permease protein
MLAVAGIHLNIGLATFSDAVTFALLIIILVVKPTGLFGEKATEKV